MKGPIWRPGLSRSWIIANSVRNGPTPKVLSNATACAESTDVPRLGAFPRLIPFLLPSPTDRPGGGVVIPRFGVFAGGVYKVAKQLTHIDHLLSAPVPASAPSADVRLSATVSSAPFPTGQNRKQIDRQPAMHHEHARHLGRVDLSRNPRPRTACWRPSQSPVEPRAVFAVTSARSMHWQLGAVKPLCSGLAQPVRRPA